ncbi:MULTISPECIES: translation initiation factor IF-2 [Caproicibacterium]|jgi:translation initiation factor IF-2|uniref:Translation initiation factor IF-2 n=1 Tax=Caproicibacterium lactatifermentans TaxID=2666138 RepID=A0A859DRC6_9FIRM|nr:translation initiation factor IF-2 [Caproicibacterium lactatifermentans]ARP51187.1 translation initiation factor IF-2 [Ruminococcaceae bacterium CPB6]MDD4806994.1 translation initiation factor IF-2 [Oscillospiraceae bacterium]QKN24687.1 translation initiation factor IF-2 [Caproicibacterium lactatifermentans]QKO30186.1 translation initiation factor IF-2 [Caproicibacterium lactatifermentans]
MMIKYRVHEVAKDLNVPNKDVIDVLQKYTGETKKHMTALNEDELDLVFETFTQKNNKKDLNDYFAQREERAVTVSEEGSAKEIPLKEAAKKQENNGRRPGRNARGAQNQNQNQNRNQNNRQPGKPQQKGAAAKPKKDSIRQKATIIGHIGLGNDNASRHSHERIVDTRSHDVELDKYNEKYDRLANEKVKTDNVVHKQKLNQKSARYRRGRRPKRETEAERLRRIAAERKAKPITVQIPESITVGELALRLKATVAEVIKKLMQNGVFASINDEIDFDTASLVAMEFHAKVEKEVEVTIEEQIIDDSEDKEEDLETRAPVVVVMGHVDHGKTSLLDAIRHTNVTSSEAGGITQHIGAYQVKVNDRMVTFLDTPGHEAFTTMRARGAMATDIAVLVVAADDGVMPQTIEAIHHAKAAKVNIIVAVNKIDKPGANPQMVMEQLTKYGIVPEEWGGNVPCIPVSAKTGTGLNDLLEMILLVADMKELKANPNRPAKGVIIEARLDKGRGPIATMLVQNGTLHQGDIVVAGTSVGRVRAMTNESGREITSAKPSVPVEVTGLDSVPAGGDTFNAVSDERLARELVEQRRTAKKEEKFNARTKVTLDNLFEQMQLGDMKELQLIVKADVQGSVEAVTQSLEKISNDEVRVNVIHGAVGAISESDVMLAAASNAIIVGFNVRPDPVAEENAKRDGVDIRLYRVIYDCIQEIESAMKGMLDPKYREVQLGRAECRETYKISSVGLVIGAHVVSGKITRGASARVVRDGIVVADDTIASLRRFKDDVKEVVEGYDCGICLEKFSDIKIGDILEAYTMEAYQPE